MTTWLTDLGPALLLGLMGAAHCMGMCGGIMAALALRSRAQQAAHPNLQILAYNIGRIGSYTLMGFAFGSLVHLAPQTGWPIARSVAGVLLIGMGLYMADWWRGLRYLENLGGLLWRIIKPLSGRLPSGGGFGTTLILGSIWGWLPCGLVYSALAYAAAQGTPTGGAGVMLAFGLGTLPAVVAGGMLAGRLRRRLAGRALRGVLGLLYIVFGAWTLYGAWHHAGHHHDPGSTPRQSDNAAHPSGHSHHH